MRKSVLQKSVLGKSVLKKNVLEKSVFWEHFEERQKRIENYRRFFRHFDSVGHGVAWVISILKCSKSSAMLWRCRKRCQPIPEKKLKTLTLKFKLDSRFSKAVL